MYWMPMQTMWEQIILKNYWSIKTTLTTKLFLKQYPIYTYINTQNKHTKTIHPNLLQTLHTHIQRHAHVHSQEPKLKKQQQIFSL